MEKETSMERAWKDLFSTLKGSIEKLGQIEEVRTDGSTMIVDLSTCKIYFSYQSRDQSIDVVVGSLTGERSETKAIALHPAVELFFTGHLNILKDNFRKGPESVVLPSGRELHFGYIARLMEADFVTEVIESDYARMSEYNEWSRKELKTILEKIREITHRTD